MPSEKKTWADLKWHTKQDFESSDVSGSGDLMDLRVALLCDRIAEALGYCLRIASGVRSLSANKKAKGVSSSAHLPLEQNGGKACAVDVKISTSGERFLVLKILLSWGVHRIGVYDKHIHFDLDTKKPQGVAWLGKST